MRTHARLCALAATLVLALLSTGTAHAADASETLWLCHPALNDDACDGSLLTTVQEPDGTTRTEDAAAPADPPVDCFYVYPTVSNQPGPTATKTNEPEVQSIARYQAQRFSQQCRVVAPVYRQGTVAGIFTGGFTDATRHLAYDDVLNAWKDYLAHDNRGRGVVLVGHSQGTGILRRLVREQVDPSAAMRARLVSAVLLGGNVTVQKGRDRGGDFANVPVCAKSGQTGCVIAFSTFLDDPPDDTRFGRVPTGVDRLTGLPPRTDTEVACTNPGSLAANAETPFTTYVPTAPFAPGLIALSIAQVYAGQAPTAPTPWVQPADRYAGRCQTINGANVLKLRQLPGARHLNASPDATWGLHIVDMNIALGQVQQAVDAQSAAFVRHAAAAKRRPRVKLGLYAGLGRTRSGLRCVRSRTTARVTGPDRPKATRVEFRLRGRRVVLDRKAPFAARVTRSRLTRRAATLTARVTFRDGRTRTLRTPLRACR